MIWVILVTTILSTLWLSNISTTSAFSLWFVITESQLSTARLYQSKKHTGILINIKSVRIHCLGNTAKLLFLYQTFGYISKILSYLEYKRDFNSKQGRFLMMLRLYNVINPCEKVLNLKGLENLNLCLLAVPRVLSSVYNQY